MSGRYNGSYMRAYKILPTAQIKAASLSPEAHQRLWWLDWYVFHGRNAEMTCRHFGISKSVFYRWKARYNPKNLKPLEDDKRTRRPQHLRGMMTPDWIIQKIIDIRSADIEKSKYEIQEELRRQGIAVGQSAIQKVINRNPLLRNAHYRNKYRAHKKRAIARLKAASEMKERAPGSLVQVDTKYFYVLGKKYYLFTAIDCKTRYGFLWCYKTISSASAADFVRKVREYFPFPIAAINTDNGSEYLLHFHEKITSWGIPHFFTDPYCPKQNSRVERLHQTAEYEYFCYQDDLLDDLDMINQRCMMFNDKYNYHRFHRSLGYKTPGEYVSILLNLQKGQPFSI